MVCGRWCGERRCVTKWCVTKRCVKHGVSKMVFDKVGCKRWCVKDGVLQRWCVKEGVSKMVCDKVVCERWCVWQSCVWKMVCERWWVTKWCVKDGVWQSGVWKRVCQRWCHACHAKPRWMWDCATPATWNEGGCHQVPRLPRKVPRRHARLNRAQARHPVPWVPRLPRKTKVDVRLCHACHMKRRWMSPSVTPATQSAAASRATKPGPRAPPSAISVTPATQNQGGCEIVPRLPRKTKVDVRMWEMVCEVTACERWYVTKLCLKFVCVCEVLYVRDGMWRSCVLSLCWWSYYMWEMVCEVTACERWYVTKLCLKFVCVCEVLYVRDGMWRSCVLSLCWWSFCMWEMVCDVIVCERYWEMVCDKVVC